jgi:triosephosphate isomerase
MRKKLIAGNWKMFTTSNTARLLAAAVAKGVGIESRVEVLVCPPFPYLSAVGEAIKGSSVLLGGQNCYHAAEGAFTGEVSPAMLLDVGCKYVILGHSERRRIIGEESELINRKLQIAIELGLHAIVCAGETLPEREAGRAFSVVEDQLRASLAGYPHERLGQLLLAYEPVWAIGTGKNATPAQALEMHAFLRSKLISVVGNHAQTIRLLYGGSVKPENAAVLIAQPDVDGVLVGGASLKADQFLAIIRAALPG